MNLNSKISFIVSLSFTIIFAVSASIIYLLFEDFRKDEFQIRLNEKAISSIKLLVEVEEVDRQLLKIIDQNSINKLYNEKTLIFDADYNLIYSSLDDTKINWTVDDLKYLKAEKYFFRKEKAHEIYGVFYDTNDKDYYALISAQDNFGKRKLEYLLYILIATYLGFTIITWLLSYGMVKKLLSPIDNFLRKIKGINENNLDTRIPVKERKDEIDLLAEEFNQMLERIANSYKKQQEFTANASHELRTPIARITAQLENEIIAENSSNASSAFNVNLLNDVNQLSELTNSLLLLSKLDSEIRKQNEVCRIDELIFEAAEKVNKIFFEFRIDLEFLEIESLEIKGNKPLLTIAFVNLFKNAYLYSDSKQVKIEIESTSDKLTVTITNDGKTISSNDQNKIFEPFLRGQNAKDKSGLGLGLRIVKRILNQEKAKIGYSISADHQNQFRIQFPAYNS